MVASFYVQPDPAVRNRVSATILLARHGSHAEVGQVLSGRSEIGLSPDGHAQAGWLAERLAGTPLAAVHSSPRRRTMETAEAVARRHAIRVDAFDALDELDFGDWAGLRFDALEGDPAWRRWNEARGRAATPGGETMAEATTRAVRHIEAVDGQAGPVLCVSHCDIIRGVVAHYLELDADRLLAFDVDPGSLTTLAVEGDRGRLVALNERMP